MIRVAFLLTDFGPGWLGGLNYYRSLITAMDLLDPRNVQPVLFVGSRVPTATLAGFGDVEIVKTRLFDRGTMPGRAWQLLSRIPVVAPQLLAALLRRHRIDVLSHAGPLPRAAGIRTVGWIPDFQHHSLPDFFTPREHRLRQRHFEKLLDGCDTVVVSSRSAMDDLARAAPAAVGKARLLHFVPQIDVDAPVASLAQLESKYSFTAPYFHLPNQFWAHKNHRLVVEALDLLKRSGEDVRVIATGNTEDYRNPAHFGQLVATVSRLGLEANFRVLGIVSYGDMIALMRHSLAVINPSLFEGWSTTVEEAKVFGKTLLLSDIPVHREQNPADALYFDPDQGGQLAEAMRTVLRRQPLAPGSGVVDLVAYQAQRGAFAENYRRIVADAGLST